VTIRSVAPIALLALALSAVLAWQVVASRPAAAAPACHSLELLGLRGLQDPPGMGDDSAAVAAEVQQMLVPFGYDVGTAGVQFDGLPSFIDILSPVNQFLVGNEQQAQQSISQYAATCPRSVIALIGQSEGAAILHQIIGGSMGPVPFSAAVFLGDPLHIPGTSYDWDHDGDGTGQQGFGAPAAVWAATTSSTPNDIPGFMEPLIHSYCLPGDFVCGGNCLNFLICGIPDLSAHTSYRFNRDHVKDRAAGFLAQTVLPFLPPPFGTPPPNPLPTPTPGPAPTSAALVVPNPAGLFLYNPHGGTAYVELPDGHGGWSGIAGGYFSAGWNVYTGRLNGDALTDLFL